MPTTSIATVASKNEEEQKEEPPIFPTPQARLEYLYKDVTRLSQIAAPDFVLHPADRDLHTPPQPPLRGIAAAQQHEEDFVVATGGTLVMEVESITVSRDGSFGCVMGALKADGGDGSACESSRSGSGKEDSDQNAVEECEGGVGEEDETGEGKDEGRLGVQVGSRSQGKVRRGRIEMPFCGMWRFDDLGRAVEHWENAADPETLAKWLRGE